MARSVSIGLFPEGPTDARFFFSVLRRLVVDLCGRAQVDVPEEVIDLSEEEVRQTGARREDRILQATRRNAASLSLVFVHADGAGAPERMRVEQCEPGIALIHQTFPERLRAIALVPIREMEAWALVDGDAIREVTGSRLGDAALGLPSRVATVEAITDPKAKLQSVFALACPRSSRRSQERHGAYLGLLGEAVRLVRLRELEAFQRLEQDTRLALEHLGVLR